MRFPITIETSWGGFKINESAGLRRIVKFECGLSPGFISMSDDSILLSILLSKVDGEVIDS